MTTVCQSIPLDPKDRLATYPAQPEAPPKQFARDLPPVAFDETYIIDIVTSRVRRGRDMVGRYYFAAWNAARGHLLDELNSDIRQLRHRVPLMLREADRAHRDYERHRVMTPFANWPAWALAKFICLIVMMVVLGGASFAGMFQLLASTPAYALNLKNCLAVSALVLAVPFAIKLFPETLKSETARLRVYQFFSLLTVVLFVVFAVLLSLVTGGNAAVLGDPLDPSTGAGVGMAASLSVHLQYVQLFLEVSGSLACFCHASLLYSQHMSRWGAPHPDAIKYLVRAVQAQETYRTENSRLGAATGQRRALLADRSAYVFRAVSVFIRRSDLAKRQEEGIQRKQGADARPPGFGSSRLKQFIDRVADHFSN